MFIILKYIIDILHLIENHLSIIIQNMGVDCGRVVKMRILALEIFRWTPR